MLREKIVFARKNVMKEKLEKLADEMLQNNKNFVVWGCGNTGRDTIDFLKTYSNGKLAPEYIVDNNKSFWKEGNVKSPLLFQKDMNNIDVVLVCVYVADQVIEQIKSMDYQGYVFPVTSTVFNINDDIRDFYCAHMERIEMMYEMLADEQSMKTVETFLNVIYSGDISLWEGVNGNSKSKLVDPEVLLYNENDNYIDIGAFTGDTLQKFLQLNKKSYNSIVCIEPDEKNFDVLNEYVKSNKLNNVLVLNRAAGKENGVLTFSGNRSESSKLSEIGETKVQVLALDTLPEAANVSILKISTNGFEMDVLMGAQEIIRRNKPQIACYASGEQLWKIPQFLKKLVPEYKIYYRHYGIGRQAMICYARVC